MVAAALSSRNSGNQPVAIIAPRPRRPPYPPPANGFTRSLSTSNASATVPAGYSEMSTRPATAARPAARAASRRWRRCPARRQPAPTSAAPRSASAAACRPARSAPPARWPTPGRRPAATARRLRGLVDQHEFSPNASPDPTVSHAHLRGEPVRRGVLIGTGFSSRKRLIGHPTGHQHHRDQRHRDTQ